MLYFTLRTLVWASKTVAFLRVFLNQYFLIFLMLFLFLFYINVSTEAYIFFSLLSLPYLSLPNLTCVSKTDTFCIHSLLNTYFNLNFLKFFIFLFILWTFQFEAYILFFIILTLPYLSLPNLCQRFVYDTLTSCYIIGFNRKQKNVIYRPGLT